MLNMLLLDHFHQGAASGLLTSLVFTLWIAIGSVKHRPPLPVLRLVTDQCYKMMGADSNTTSYLYDEHGNSNVSTVNYSYTTDLYRPETER